MYVSKFHMNELLGKVGQSTQLNSKPRGLAVGMFYTGGQLLPFKWIFQNLGVGLP